MKSYTKIIIYILIDLVSCTYTVRAFPESNTSVHLKKNFQNGLTVNERANLEVKNTSYRVIDGDTFLLGNDKIRLWGIDAPELNQICFKDSQEVACGEVAKVVLMGILKSGRPACQTVEVDRYRRHVSQCKIGSLDVAGQMVLMGWAFDYPQYSQKFYKDFEEESKKGKHGIWALSFDKPSNWRHGTKKYIKE